MAEQAHKEPTMEEILSSIRKIIAADDGADIAPPKKSESHVDFGGVSVDAEDELDVFADLEPANIEDSFEPELPNSTEDVLQALQESATADPDMVTDDFAIEDHEVDDGISDIMDFIDFKDEEPSVEHTFEDALEPMETAEADSEAVNPFQFDSDEFETEFEESSVAPFREDGPSFEATSDEDVTEEISEFVAESDTVAEEIQDLERTDPLFTNPLETVMIQPLTDNRTVSAAAGTLSKLLENVEFGEEAGGNRTIDELVKELLRPMLKDWLDEHLQNLVESSVEAEIQRIGRRAG